MRILRENREDGCNIKISANQQKKMKELEEAENTLMISIRERKSN